MNFKGIKPEGIELLAINRFNDSKSFYESNKSKIKELVTDQLRALLDDLFDTLVEINPDFILSPARCISRVRRDTRFSNDKTLYRENLWIMFRHQKNHLPTPMMWFEFFPDGYAYGCGVICSTPAFMEYWRKSIKANPARIESIADGLSTSKLKLDDERYKRSKAAADSIDGIAAEWYDQKHIFVSHYCKSIKPLNQPKKLVKELTDAYTDAKPLYDYLLSLTKAFNGDLEGYDERS